MNKVKYKNLILHLCNLLGGKIEGKKKLYKLLYYVDFDHFEYKESMASISGDKYFRLPMGPVPSSVDEVISDLVKQNKLETKSKEVAEGFNPMIIYTGLDPADLSCFTEDELFIINRVQEIYGKLNGKQLEDLTHAEAPFVGTAPKDEIDYGLGFYRDTFAK